MYQTTAFEEDRARQDADAQWTGFRPWIVLSIISIFTIISLIDRNAISIMVPEIKSELGLSDIQFSFMHGLGFAIFYGVGGLVIGNLVDRSGPRWIMFGGISIWSLAAIGSGLAANFMQMFLARIFIGAGEGAISPCAQKTISGIFPPHRIATAMSLFAASGIIGLGLSFAAGGWLLNHLSVAPLQGMFAGLSPWRQVLIILALPGLFVAFLAFLLPARIRTSGSPEGAAAVDWFFVLRHIRREWRLFLPLLGAYSLLILVGQSTMTWAPTYARRVLGMAPGDVGNAMSAIIIIGGTAGMIGMGFLVDRLVAAGRRDAGLAIPFWAMTAALPVAITGYLADERWSFHASLIAIQLSCFAAAGTLMAMVQIVTPHAIRGRMAALLVLVVNFSGYAVGPIVVALFTDYLFRDEYSVGHAIATLIAVFGLCSIGFLRWARAEYLSFLNNHRADGTELSGEGGKNED